MDSSRGLTLSSLIEPFDAANEVQGLTPSSREYYRDAAKQLVAFLGDPDPDDVRVEDIERFLAARRRLVSPTNAKSRYDSLRPWFRWMARRGFIAKDRDPFLELSRPRVPRPVMPIPTIEASQRLLDSIRLRDPRSTRDRAIVQLLRDTGLRSSELTGLRTSDLDYASGQLLVGIHSAKGQKARIVPFGATTTAFLREWHKVRTQVLKQRGHADHGFLFLADDLRPLGSSGLGQVIARRLEQAGIDRKAWGPAVHGFRRLAIDAQLARGDSVLDVAARVGHSNITMTARYAQAHATARAIASFRSPFDEPVKGHGR